MEIAGELDDHHAHDGYRHEAFFYADTDQFMAGTLDFIRAGLASEDPTLIVLAAHKIEALRRELPDLGDQVHFADMAEVGSNPARIIPAWQNFVERHAASGRRLRGIGEPIWPERSPAELAECERHEALLNVAFPDPAFTLLCPYDTSALPLTVLEAARRNHPILYEDSGAGPMASTLYPGAEALALPFDDPLSDPPATASVLSFDAYQLREARSWVADRATAAGLSRDRAADLVLATNELTTNTLLYGGGEGIVSLWREGSAVICEVRDEGRIVDPLAGRRRPSTDAAGGRGLWIANEVCDLVQLRAFASGGVARLHMRIADAASS
jgi:anti-sigma regulatory factor (Ser/Thr protein kinase)